MIYACIHRKGGQRIVASSATAIFRLDKDNTMFHIQSHGNNITQYTRMSDSIFITTSDIIAKQFMLGQDTGPIPDSDRIFYGKWEEKQEKWIQKHPGEGCSKNR